MNAGTSSNEPVLQNNDKNTQLAGHLLQLKNSCSGVKIDIRSKEFEQYKYRDEINFTAEKVRALQKEREQIEN